VKLAVTGSRGWTDRMAVYAALSAVEPVPTVLIHGGARGADTLAADWAHEHAIPCAVVRPVSLSDPHAYLQRNDAIVALANAVIAFRAYGQSNGTDYTIRRAKSANKLMRVVTPETRNDGDTR
jgi:hypothetical protein